MAGPEGGGSACCGGPAAAAAAAVAPAASQSLSLPGVSEFFLLGDPTDQSMRGTSRFVPAWGAATTFLEEKSLAATSCLQEFQQTQEAALAVLKSVDLQTVSGSATSSSTRSPDGDAAQPRVGLQQAAVPSPSDSLAAATAAVTADAFYDEDDDEEDDGKRENDVNLDGRGADGEALDDSLEYSCSGVVLPQSAGQGNTSFSFGLSLPPNNRSGEGGTRVGVEGSLELSSSSIRNPAEASLSSSSFVALSQVLEEEDLAELRLLEGQQEELEQNTAAAAAVFPVAAAAAAAAATTGGAASETASSSVTDSGGGRQPQTASASATPVVPSSSYPPTQPEGSPTNRLEDFVTAVRGAKGLDEGLQGDLLRLLKSMPAQKFA